jgi:hypothetical protein
VSDANQPGLFEVSYKEPRRVRGSKSGPREHYMNFGGWFSHPQEDIDTFVRLPRWRQKEILTTQAAIRRDPTLRAFEIHDPSAGKPYPNQNVYELPEGIYLSHQGPPNSVKYNVPDGVTLTVLKKFGSPALRDAVDEHERKELGYLI